MKRTKRKGLFQLHSGFWVVPSEVTRIVAEAPLRGIAESRPYVEIICGQRSHTIPCIGFGEAGFECAKKLADELSKKLNARLEAA